MKTGEQTVYYHYNPRGDVIAMTDENGQVVANYEYDAWGNVLKSDAKGIAAENPFGYAGYMYDKEIGMYYLIARYYNPTHGVFLSVDPDPDGHKSWKQKFNRVWYATKAEFKAGRRAVWKSYADNFGALISTVGTAYVGYKYGKTKYLKQNTPAFNKKYVNKSARIAGVKMASKSLEIFGLLPDAYTFVTEGWKGGKAAYKSYGRTAYKSYGKKKKRR
ncbi:RHS repeat-associated core domain-containing protein [Bacillus sp. WLY-B-L8]|nr:RHS repeat-associated core domain-containing protein [Bacillus sp. WLY-B-L8]MDP7978538.1 RHS repeat-associated core domain-containing protein [Bacillus sp. WLY-B-L8]